MLTKDLLRYSLRQGSIKPKFIDAGDESLLRIAQNMLELYDPEVLPTRGDLEELIAPMLNSLRDLKLTKGLNKLILDKCVFAQQSDVEFPKLRANLFAHSTNAVKSLTSATSFEEYQAQVLQKNSDDFPEFDGDIYGDLPDNEILEKGAPYTPELLLHRYNVSLVQSLVIYTQRVTVTVEDADPAALRALFRYVRFFRLLIKVVSVQMSGRGKNKQPRKVVFEVDGPASIFENTQKYGLQLSNFFPAVCLMEKWKFEATVEIRKKESRLRLTQKSHMLKSHYRGASYTPEEIRMFEKHFADKVQEWSIEPGSEFILAADESYIFPDFTFENESSDIVHLELFHRWHATPLQQRLIELEERPDLNLIIGVDRALSNKKDIAAILESSTYFQERGFLFRDFPGVATVAKCLDSYTS